MSNAERVAAAVTVATTGTAAQILAAFQSQAGSPVQAAVASGFTAASGGLKPQIPTGALASEPKPATVVLPQLGSGAMHLQDTTSGAAVDITLQGAAAVAAQAVGGYIVYPAACGGSAAVLHRPIASGSEDFLYLPYQPVTTEVDYAVSLGAGVAGPRVVGGEVEMLDSSGAPRLRVAPPYVVGADGTAVDGSLAISDCLVDTDPSSPWGRPVTDPDARSCTARVTWPSTGVLYPAILDPRLVGTT